ncbi:hypothetical protein FA95DRAFT_1551750 [Auriscalpium vulgare]|uniref:Uncharacterized protein n=1 Tax=Auriscalpium vulgare TaxID=40419 RepID=A0ACB8SE21_9AGAM|nr:hypothetical protein FA95DRAFT_1551750 [Auriscalpium vulgare]
MDTRARCEPSLPSGILVPLLGPASPSLRTKVLTFKAPAVQSCLVRVFTHMDVAWDPRMSDMQLGSRTRVSLHKYRLAPTAVVPMYEPAPGGFLTFSTSSLDGSLKLAHGLPPFALSSVMDEISFVGPEACGPGCSRIPCDTAECPIALPLRTFEHTAFDARCSVNSHL